MVLNHNVPGLVGFVIFTILVSTFAIVLRFWARIVSPSTRFGWDDWLALAAWPFAIGICGLVLNAWSWDLGTHVSDLPADKYTHLLQLLYAGDILFDFSISFSKISALAFYGRVFRIRTNPSRAWKICFWIVTGLAIAWPIASIPYTIAQCSPVWKFWLPDTEGNCFGLFNNFISSALSNVIIDILILVLPIPQIIQLRLPTQRKLLVVGTFLLGYSVPLMSIGRLVTAGQAGNSLVDDATYATTPILYWITAECGLSIVAVCLPGIFQLYKRVYAYGIRSLLSSRDFSMLDSRHAPARTGQSSNRGGSTTRSLHGFQRLFNRSHRSQIDSTKDGISHVDLRDVSAASLPSRGSEHVPLGSIRVRTEYEVDVAQHFQSGKRKDTRYTEEHI